MLNAHIDPVWLWPLHAGLDVILNTCYSVCNLLDRHDDLIFTRGEAWVYRQIERIDPVLYARIASHIAAGRWELVGGWWVQPDCNLPSGAGMAKQIEIGKSEFLNRFAQFPEIGWNVDSFGHAASLPTLMKRFGQNAYVMMRPQEWEMELPSRLFRWRSPGTDDEVVTFRVASCYSELTEMTREHVEASLSEIPKGVEHTMCLVGVGDHGGGPTERAIQWVRDHEEAFEGVKLVFSSPKRFFEAIAPQIGRLPVVEGELQHHAIGCYSVMRPIKLAVARAEAMLLRAERAFSSWGAEIPDSIHEAWRTVCLHQFHDTLAGTCLPSAYQAVLEQLGGATSVAQEIIQYRLRQTVVALPEASTQRLAIFNPSEDTFHDYIFYEPWLETREAWDHKRQLIDDNGDSTPYQIMTPEAAVPDWLQSRLMFKARLLPGQMRVWQLSPERKDSRIEAEVEVPLSSIPAVRAEHSRLIHPNVGVNTDVGAMVLNGANYPLPYLQLIDDQTDTWSHQTEAYASEGERYILGKTCIVDNGPLFASIVQMGRIGTSPTRLEWRCYSGIDAVELRIHVDWCQRLAVLKLALELPEAVVGRTDATLAGSTNRHQDGKERPIQHATQITFKNGGSLGIACPGIFALDGIGNRVRLTLLRSCAMAHHFPLDLSRVHRPVYADQGSHMFAMRFYGSALSLDQMRSVASHLAHPPELAETTRGMPR